MAAKEIKFQVVHRGGAPWRPDLQKIATPEKLAEIQRVLEKKGPVIVAHWHFYGSRAPDRMVFDDFDEFVTYLEREAIAGDIVEVWDMAEVCTERNTLATGKCHDEEGRVPEKGAY